MEVRFHFIGVGTETRQLPKVNAELVSGGLGSDSDMSAFRSFALYANRLGQVTENGLHIWILFF